MASKESDIEVRSERSDSGVLRHSALTTFDFGVSENYNKNVIEGYLKRQLGGIFLKWRKSWAVLQSNGRLLLSKNKNGETFASINICEFQGISFLDDDASITFSTVIGGTIETLKFVVPDSHALNDWVIAFEHFVGHSSSFQGHRIECASEVAQVNYTPPPPSQAAEEIKQTTAMSSLDGYEDDNDDDHLLVDPTEKVQSGGEPVKKSGFIKKRGGAKGGSTAFKRRWFVLTQYGRVLYFRTPRSFQALGQFTVLKSSLVECAKLELRVVTLTRTWELQFESIEDRDEWVRCIKEVSSQDEQQIELARSAKTKAARRNTLLQSASPKVFQRKSANMYMLSCDADAAAVAPLVLRPHPGKWHEISVACVTWNLAETLPSIGELRFLKKLRDCNIVTVGVQECQPVMYRNFSSDELTPIDVWQAMVQTILGESFTLVAARAMGAIHICVLVKCELVDHISDVNTAHISCGIGNVMYNKGAVGVSMRLFDTSIAFICAHLAANREKIAERNNDFHRIASQIVEGLTSKNGARSRRGTKFDEMTPAETSHDFTYDVDGDVRCQERRSTVVELSTNPLTLDSNDDTRKTGNIRRGGDEPVDSGEWLARCFDRCFFLGDLNYRLEAEKQWTQTLLAMRERMLLMENEIISTIPQLSRSSPLEEHMLADQYHKGVDEEGAYFNEGRGNPRENEVQMLLNMLPQVIYGSDCEDDDYDDDFPAMDVVNLEKESSLENSASDSICELLGSSHAVGDTPLLLRRDTSGTVPLDAIDLKVDSGTSMSPADYVVRRATSDVSNLTIESDTLNMGDELLRLSDDDDASTLLQLQSIASRTEDDAPSRKGSATAAVLGSKLLSDSAKHTLDFFVSQTGLDKPIKIIDRLLCFDQLLNERKKGTVFKGFEEGRIDFKPSYKFDPYTETYDTGKKSRAPAWCDRILYNTPRYEKELSLLSYECEHGRYHSDHRAVIAKFSVQV